MCKMLKNVVLLFLFMLGVTTFYNGMCHISSKYNKIAHIELKKSIFITLWYLTVLNLYKCLYQESWGIRCRPQRVMLRGAPLIKDRGLSPHSHPLCTCLHIGNNIHKRDLLKIAHYVCKEENPGVSLMHLLPIFNREWIRLLEHVLKCIDFAVLLYCVPLQTLSINPFTHKAIKPWLAAVSEHCLAEVLSATQVKIWACSDGLPFDKVVSGRWRWFVSSSGRPHRSHAGNNCFWCSHLFLRLVLTPVRQIQGKIFARKCQSLFNSGWKQKLCELHKLAFCRDSYVRVTVYANCASVRCLGASSPRPVAMVTPIKNRRAPHEDKSSGGGVTRLPSK